MEEFLILLGWVRTKVLTVCHGLAEVRSDTVQDDIDEIMVRHLGIHSKPIDIIQVFLDSSCLPEITNLVQSPVWHVVVTIVLSNGIFNFYQGTIPEPVCFPPF